MGIKLSRNSCSSTYCNHLFVSSERHFGGETGQLLSLIGWILVFQNHFYLPFKVNCTITTMFFINCEKFDLKEISNNSSSSIQVKHIEPGLILYRFGPSFMAL